MVLELGVRLDGRKTTDIRPIWCETDYLPKYTALLYLLVEKHKLWLQ